MDMHSGGGSKEAHDYIYIELPYEPAVRAFNNIFGHDPLEVACACCGENYSISDGDILQITGHDRRASWNATLRKFEDGTGSSLEDYVSREDVRFIRASEIK
jgi:hypothetical protein